MPTWETILARNVSGPTVPVSAVVETVDAEHHNDLPVRYRGMAPAVGLPEGPVRLWRHGRRIRIDVSDDQPWYRTDGETAWRFFGGQSDSRPSAERLDAIDYIGPGAVLLGGSKRQSEWVATAIGDDELSGRRVWLVELDPTHGVPLRLFVDQQTGQVLRVDDEYAVPRVQVKEFQILDEIDASWFEFSGDATDLAGQHAREQAEYERRLAEQRVWFAENVGPPEFSVNATIDFDHLYIHERADDGAFDATLGRRARGGRLRRRRRSSEPWDLGWSGEVRRWSDAHFDWAFTVEGASISDDEVSRIRVLLSRYQPSGQK